MKKVIILTLSSILFLLTASFVLKVYANSPVNTYFNNVTDELGQI
ncbi:hypothetical protein J2T12_002478 [Paenibacillus anaericanus]|nr:hypothetical protein [Paenibacillus anaericanus]